jgi:hypothetical protein
MEYSFLALPSDERTLTILKTIFRSCILSHISKCSKIHPLDICGVGFVSLINAMTKLLPQDIAAIALPPVSHLASLTISCLPPGREPEAEGCCYEISL